MSVLRRFSNPFQNWDRKAPRSDDLRPEIKDHVFEWQIGSTDFCRLDQESLLRADICGNKTYAEKVLKACHKLGIIDQETGRPITTKIDRNMAKAMPTISLQKQRELVMLLFFWEEETTRWRLLSTEENDIHQRLGEEGLREGFKVELEYALQIVQAKKRVMPSLRDSSGRVISADDEQLPTYAEARAQRHSSV